jgi:2,3-bisphosphoglycerate-dependent phosphoglycerate mutase
MRITFARHGESQANVANEIANRGLRYGLTRRGRQQAEALAERLRGRPIARIVCSPLLRAVETAIVVAQRLDLDYAPDDALREYDCGVLEGRSDEEAWRLWHELADAWLLRGRLEERLEGGESFNDVRARFEPFLAGLLRSEAGGTGAEVLCVAHGGLYRLMLPLLLRDCPAALAERGFGYASTLSAEVRAGALYCVEWDGQPLRAGD